MPTSTLPSDAKVSQAIIDHLKGEGFDSISGVARTVSEGRDKPLHRLTVAGYLQAMAEAGVLQELDRPPSKYYRLANPDAHLSLHQRLGRILQEADMPAERRVLVLVAVLEHILERPIFRGEIRHAGFDDMPEDLVPVDAGEDERRVYRSLLRPRGQPIVQLPRGDPLYRAPSGYSAVSSSVVAAVLRRLVLQTTGSHHLAAPGSTQGAQTHLALEEDS